MSEERFAVRIDFEANEDLGIEAMQAVADASAKVLNLYRATNFDETFYIADEQVDEEGDSILS